MDVFDIEKLECAYPPNGKRVLSIDRLTIPRGKMTVILGRSGSGKSTLVEALGLMNNTIASGEVTYFSPRGNEDLAKLWNKRKAMAAIRRDYFSFIFQDDYLMPYYSCVENMLITGLIQGKIPTSQTGPMLEIPLGFLNLSGNGLLKQVPGELAGGQKQRLSFIRAVMKKFDVLFGDEPTGNLDYTNSATLFDFIKVIIHEKSGTAVIVSHNVELTVDKADRIIVLTPGGEPGRTPFSLQPHHVFDRSPDGNWGIFKKQQDLTDYIKSIL
ncbi:MAG: ABC transporter ATP-binding protein [Bacteroidota bacterium]